MVYLRKIGGGGKIWFKTCIESCLNQTYQNIEVVIVDDGSTDRTEDLVKGIKDTRIRYYKKEHSGISDTLNYGILRCNGEYIARMDADDIMLNDRIRIQVNEMEKNKDCDVCCGGFIRQYEDGRKSNIFMKKNVKYINDREDILYDMRHGKNHIGHPTVMFRTNIFKKLSIWYDTKYDGKEDLQLWNRLLENDVKILNLEKVLIVYRCHAMQSSKIRH